MPLPRRRSGPFVVPKFAVHDDSRNNARAVVASEGEIQADVLAFGHDTATPLALNGISPDTGVVAVRMMNGQLLRVLVPRSV